MMKVDYQVSVPFLFSSAHASHTRLISWFLMQDPKLCLYFRAQKICVLGPSYSWATVYYYLWVEMSCFFPKRLIMKLLIWSLSWEYLKHFHDTETYSALTSLTPPKSTKLCIQTYIQLKNRVFFYLLLVVVRIKYELLIICFKLHPGSSPCRFIKFSQTL